MNPLVVICVAGLLGVGCDRGATADKGPTGSASPAVDGKRDITAEQAEFDRERRPDLVLAAIGLKAGDVVADIGAGTGLLTMHLARAVSPGGKVVATDVDAAVLDLQHDRLDAAGLDSVVDHRVVTPDDPGLEAGAFDVIFLAQVDHYLSDATAWLRAALPALKPGGRVVLTNRVHHRARGMAAAAAAGLTLLRESTEIPGQYVAVFTRTP